MLKLAAILLIAHFAAGEQVININKNVDNVLVKVNDALTKSGLGLRKLPDVTYPEVGLSNGYQLGVNSMYRKGDAFLTIHDDKTHTVDLHVGFKLFALAYGSIKSNGVEMSGGYIVRDNSFHVSYNVVRSPACKVTLGDYQFDNMSNVGFVASLPGYDGDVSDVFSKYVVPRVNERISHVRGKVEQRFQKLICQKHLNNDYQMGDELVELLSSLEHMY